MTEKAQCKRFNKRAFPGCMLGVGTFLGMLFSFSCATANLPSGGEGRVETSTLRKLPLDIQAELSSDAVQSGTVAFLTLDVPAEVLSSGRVLKGNFEGIQLPFFPMQKEGEEAKSRYGAVFGVPYERIPGPAYVELYAENETEKKSERISLGKILFQVVKGDYPSEVLKVDGRRVHPKKKKDLIRIEREQKEIGEIYQNVTHSKYWQGPFVAPIDSQITSAFGTRRVYNGELRNFHSGVDLRAPMMTPIYSAASGKVVLAKNLFYTGNTVILDHGYGVITLYAHMSQLKVKKGDEVTAHHLLGLSGMTGRVNGPHLHWQAVVHKIKVNPYGLIQVMR